MDQKPRDAHPTAPPEPLPPEWPHALSPVDPEHNEVLDLGRNKDGCAAYVLRPTVAYMRRRWLPYVRTFALVLAVVAALCGAYALATGRGHGAFALGVVAAFVAGVALIIWNQTVSCPLLIEVGKILRLRIARLRVEANPALGEKLGLARAANGRTWQLYYLSPTKRQRMFQVHAAAFPDLPQFLAEKAPGLWEELAE